jgi:hypothetical protein
MMSIASLSILVAPYQDSIETGSMSLKALVILCFL